MSVEKFHSTQLDEVEDGRDGPFTFPSYGAEVDDEHPNPDYRGLYIWDNVNHNFLFIPPQSAIEFVDWVLKYSIEIKAALGEPGRAGREVSTS